MERIDGVLGNVRTDATLAAERERHEIAGTLESLVVDETDRRRSRLRAATDAGTDLGILVDRPLSPGDVLACREGWMVVVELEPREALAVDLPAPSPAATARAVELGHAIGNRHWDLAVVDEVAYVPLEADRQIVEQAVGAVLPEAARRVERVDAELFLADDSGGRFDAGEPGHGHTHEESAHEHGHEEYPHGHKHDRRHEHEHEHVHTFDEADRREE